MRSVSTQSVRVGLANLGLDAVRGFARSRAEFAL